ncbi:MAG TPA: response regulator [Blastocatellia bacterium]|jgi:two-component system chemotaxis response regulator CheY|nr:response regulator [Blastocatellia bacterium]
MPKKILVVEDNLDTRELFHLYLSTEGFTVVTASDGREGLYMAQAERPDLIITDMNMPNLDGITLVRQLRAQAEFKDVPIIVCTAFGIESRDNAIRAGANRAVDKPTHFEGIIDDINELLDQPKKK